MKRYPHLLNGTSRSLQSLSNVLLAFSVNSNFNDPATVEF